MLKTDLIKLLSSLSPAEFRKFGKFLDSTYFNTNSKLIEFYEILKEHYPDFDSLELSKENIYRKLYKEDKVVMGTMYYLISEMESLLEKFISIERIKPFTLDLTLLEVLDELGISSLYDKKYKVLKKELNHLHDTNNLNNFLLAKINCTHQVQKKNFRTNKDNYRKEWYEPMDQLIKFFLKSILTDLEMLSNFKRTQNETLTIPLLTEIINFIETNKAYLDDIEIRALYFEIKMLTSYEDKYYYELKKILKEDSNKLFPDQCIEIILSLQQYCTQKLLIGENSKEEEFELATLAIRFQLMEKNSHIPVDMFYKMFMLGMALEKYDWGKEFIGKHIKHLDEQFQNNAYHYCSARLHYQNKDYDRALKDLSKIKQYSFIHFKPAVKILQLMIFYDLRLISEAEDTANSFVQFLRNDKLITSGIQKAYKNFLRIYFKLIKTEFTNNKSKILDIKASIENQKELLIARKWFLKRIAEMEMKLNKNVRVM
ncbi:MAG: hypothetical protein ABI462_12425 [Ignavibacteria bacterium]